ncbi:MAG: hypothetical protein IKH04_05450 [Kiritimatiellae bacterium]|nr:hypothetical protein [Kiritimatiellia bacterium]
MTTPPPHSAPPRLDTRHFMLRRCLDWDYKAPCIYQITLVLADRASNALGRLVVDADGMEGGVFSPEAVRAHVEPSPQGRAVLAEWQNIGAHHPEVRPLFMQLMPDHVHFIVRVERQLDRPLGQVIAGFKAGSSKAATGRPGLWADGFQDTILFHEGQLNAMFGYLRDNPRRQAVKRLAPQLFRMRRDLAVDIPALPCRAQDRVPGTEVPGFTAHFEAIGNDFLLKAPHLLQVQCSRSDFAYRRVLKAGKPGVKLARDAAGAPICAMATPAFEERCATLLAAARHGAVLVSPCVSDGEREIARRAFEAGASLIALRNMGFSPLYKPGGRLFDQTANGKLLLLAPAAWPYSTADKPMTRSDACAMNRIAQWIAGNGAADIRYRGMEPRDVERAARAAVQATPNTSKSRNPIP